MQQVFNLFMAVWWKRIIAFMSIILFLFFIRFGANFTFGISNELFIFIGLIIASFVVEKLRITNEFYTFGIQINRYVSRHLLFSIIWGFFSMTLIFFLLLIFGYKFKFLGISNLNYFLQVTFLIFLISANEELFFRGVIFQSMLDRFNPFTIVIISNILFAGLHLMNNGSSLISSFNTFLAGVLLSLIYLQSKSLLFAVMYHFSWNFFQNLILSSPVSNFDFGIGIFKYSGVFESENILFGSVYGIESGVFVTLILSFTIFWVLKFVRESPEISAFNFKRIYLEEAIKKIPCSKL